MKKIVALFAIGILLFSCKDEVEVPQVSSGGLSISFLVGKSSQKITSVNVSYAIVSIEDDKGGAVYLDELLPIYKFEGSYISKTLDLKVGKYFITKFLLTDSAKNVVYATPLANSKLAYLVNKPLPVALTIQKDIVQKSVMEVISTTNILPSDFGYATFSFNVKEQFEFLLATLVYNKVKANFELTDAQLEITSGSTFKYTESLKPLTTVIILPKGYTTFNINISKAGYKSYSSTISADSLKKNFNSPLMITLEENVAQLIANYTFNGNINDASGNGHNGSINDGPAAYVTGRKGDVNGAINFSNGSSVSAAIGRLGSMTISAWVKMPEPTTWYPAIIEYTASIPYYGAFHFGYTGNIYPTQDQGKVGYIINYDRNDNTDNTTNRDFYQTSPLSFNVWNHITVTYDSATQVAKMYVNNSLVNSQTCKNSLYNLNLSQITIGRLLVIRPDKPTGLGGSIDELRIYNKALSATEIDALFNL